MKLSLNRHNLAQALRFGLNTVHLIDPMAPLRLSNGGRLMVVMPLRHDATAKAPARPAEEARHSDAKEEQPAESSDEEEASTNERNPQMRNITPAAPVASNGNGNSTTASDGHTETAPTITTALAQIETIRGSYRQAVQGLTALADTLKAVQRGQKASEKEVQSVRTTLERLQSMKL